jgi:hypothetical protein
MAVSELWRSALRPAVLDAAAVSDAQLLTRFRDAVHAALSASAVRPALAALANRAAAAAGWGHVMPALATALAAAVLVAAVATDPTPEHLRQVRACEVLEGIGVPALKVLKDWASGPAGARMTTEGRASVARLDRR